MNVFQMLGLGLLGLLAVVTIAAGVRGEVRKRIVAFWLVVWTGGGVVLVWPRSTAIVAHALGIGRGADLLLYTSVLMTLTGFFYVYTRFRRLDRQLTMLVRRMAIENPALPDSQRDAPESPAP